MVEKTMFELIDICFIWGKLTLHAQRIIDIIEILNRDISMPCSLVTFGNKNILKKIIQYGSKDFLITLDKH